MHVMKPTSSIRCRSHGGAEAVTACTLILNSRPSSWSPRWCRSYSGPDRRSTRPAFAKTTTRPPKFAAASVDRERRRKLAAAAGAGVGSAGSIQGEPMRQGKHLMRRSPVRVENNQDPVHFEQLEKKGL